MSAVRDYLERTPPKLIEKAKAEHGESVCVSQGNGDDNIKKYLVRLNGIFHTVIVVDNAGGIKMTCDCPQNVFLHKQCKHMVFLMLQREAE